MNEVAPRRSVRGIKLVVGETRIGAPRKGCRGLTQVEFDAASMAGAASNSKDGENTFRGPVPTRTPAGKQKRPRARPRPSFLKRKRAGSGAAPPQAAVAPRHELQVVLVAGPLLVFRQLDLFLRRLPAFSFARGDLHGFGGILQESDLVLRVLLRAQPVARRARMARDQAFPVHRQHLLDRALG